MRSFARWTAVYALLAARGIENHSKLRNPVVVCLMGAHAPREGGIADDFRALTQGEGGKTQVSCRLTGGIPASALGLLRPHAPQGPASRRLDRDHLPLRLPPRPGQRLRRARYRVTSRRLWLRPLSDDGILGRQLVQEPASGVIDANPPRHPPGHHDREFWRPCGLPGERMGSHSFSAPNHRGLFFDGQPPGWPFVFPPANPAHTKGFVTCAPSLSRRPARSILGPSAPPSRPETVEKRPKLSGALALYRDKNSTHPISARFRPVSGTPRPLHPRFIERPRGGRAAMRSA